MFKKFLIKSSKKNIDTKKVTNFDNAIKTIKELIFLKDFGKVYIAIEEVVKKENKNYLENHDKLEEKKRRKYLIILKKKIKKLEKLKEKAKKKEKEYIEYKKKIQLKIEKKQLEKDIHKFISKKEYNIILEKLDNFFEKYKSNVEVLSFVDKKRKYIQKKIKKDKNLELKKIKKDTYSEIKYLLGDVMIEKEKKENISNLPFLKRFFKAKLQSYFLLKKRIMDKKLLDEVEIMLKNYEEQKKYEVRKKLENIHIGISREIKNKNLNGYEIYGKILGADKISGDSIGFIDRKNDYVFYLGDATGHGIKARFIITKLSKKFDEFKNKFSFKKICFEINNLLKQELKSGNFITSIFFNIDKKDNKILNFVGMGHEPMLLYKKNTNEIQRIVPGGIATGIRLFKNEEDIKVKSLNMDDGDILLCYTDGLIEAKNNEGKMYSLERLESVFKKSVKNKKKLNDLYTFIISDLKNFRLGNTNFSDDVSILLLKRDVKKDFINDKKELEDIVKQEGLDIGLSKKIKGKQIQDIKKYLLDIKKEKELKKILKILDNLYKNGDYLQLKQECIRYIKEGFIHKKIKFFLEKSIENEEKFKINQKNKKLNDKYNVLKELYKKGDYETVIKEIIDIIKKEGNI